MIAAGGARTKLYLIIAAVMSVILVGYIIDVPWVGAAVLAVIAGVFLFTRSTEILFALGVLCIPFSTELMLPGGVGLEFPGELMLILLSLLAKLHLARRPLQVRWGLIGGLLLLHLSWIALTMITAEFPLISLKYLLAKTWYVLPFYVLPFYLFDRETGLFDKTLRWLLVGVAVTGVYTFFMHGLEGWTFAARTNAGKPFFRNHVNYACLLLLSLPICRYLYQQSRQRGYVLLAGILLVFLYFTYARIAYVAIAAAVGALVLLRWRVLRLGIYVTILLGVLGSIYFFGSGQYLQYAPEYESTVSHQRFDRLIEASYQMKDISSMERLHRWVAGYHMIEDRPWLGFGPSNFYSTYQPYTVQSFQTYVSDNPEHSGIHNYYLMMAVEQGIPGALIFIGLLLAAFARAESTYRDHDGYKKREIELALLWLTMISVILLLNDMVEVLKVGPFFFLSLWLMNRESNSEIAIKQKSLDENRSF